MTAGSHGIGQARALRSAPRLARHLARCAPCKESLDVLAAQGDALMRLGQADRSSRMVDRVLGACAEDGRELVADLLYEMARACLALAPEDKPEDESTKSPAIALVAMPSELASSIHRTASRIPSLKEVGDLLPSRNPSTQEAATLAKTCLAVLERVEGRSARRRYLEGRTAHYCGMNAEAIERLTPMLDEALPTWLWRNVRYSLMAALIRHGNAEAAARIGEVSLRTRPDDRMLLFNTATAYVSLGHHEAFDQKCRLFSASRADIDEGLDFWDAFLEDETRWIAARLGRDRTALRAAMRVVSNVSEGPT